MYIILLNKRRFDQISFSGRSGTRWRYGVPKWYENFLLRLAWYTTTIICLETCIFISNSRIKLFTETKGLWRQKRNFEAGGGFSSHRKLFSGDRCRTDAAMGGVISFSSGISPTCTLGVPAKCLLIKQRTKWYSRWWNASNKKGFERRM